jgi:hypothetical protein
MSAQQITTYALGAVALGYLVWRILRRQRARTCCGAKTCPAAREVARRLQQTRATPKH